MTLLTPSKNPPVSYGTLPVSPLQMASPQQVRCMASPSRRASGRRQGTPVSARSMSRDRDERDWSVAVGVGPEMEARLQPVSLEKPQAVPSGNPVSATPCRARRGSGMTGFPVTVHIYDLGPVSRFFLNSWAGQAKDSSCLGVFHCGIEVLGVEFSFQAMADCGKEDNTTGLTWHHPMSHPRHVYRESICLGASKLSVHEIGTLLERLEKVWMARTYHCLSNNCVDFAEHFIQRLGCSQPFPQWVHGLAKGLARSNVAGFSWARFLPCSQSCGSQSLASGGSCGTSGYVAAGIKTVPLEESRAASPGEHFLPSSSHGCNLFGMPR
ncbi:unnamed protein product [Polarella glacialis]|uniref:PPPDE domain-containing protein n=1 Tax=Polarella glacialis TaxID=89957 RepID=A0A813GW01_POLGL|nr:unnamed protein product [Polarella glacialis]|mmetsp:Transcript_36046/g.58156  ORF Transcript_36046/g.58156 Transcript_36046/m.58156 type:complete len:325 (-) Transcript_36046:96-1070(-)